MYIWYINRTRWIVSALPLDSWQKTLCYSECHSFLIDCDETPMSLDWALCIIPCHARIYEFTGDCFMESDDEIDPLFPAITYLNCRMIKGSAKGRKKLVRMAILQLKWHFSPHQISVNKFVQRIRFGHGIENSFLFNFHSSEFYRKIPHLPFNWQRIPPSCAPAKQL